MQVENTGTCKNRTWNSAIHKKNATRKDYQTKKCNMKIMQEEKSAAWKDFNMKKVQHEKIQIATVKYGKSTQE